MSGQLKTELERSTMRYRFVCKKIVVYLDLNVLLSNFFKLSRGQKEGEN